MNDNNPTGEVYTIIVCVLFGMMFTSFFRVATTDPGKVPDWYINAESEDQIPVYVERKADGSRRYCHKSEMWKPDRTHYCRVCQRCVLKMDHHCPWINNCVGYRNYRNFCLFMLYLAACCLFLTFVFLDSFIDTLLRPRSS